MNEIYAEDVNYWRTSNTGVETWIKKAKKEIQAVDGIVTGSATVSNVDTGVSVIMLSFRIGDDNFVMKWPTLESRSGNDTAEMIQAATALYHEVKSACVKMKFIGYRAAFLTYLRIGEKTAGEMSTEELTGKIEMAVRMPMLTSGR